jgi:N-acetylneuraminic acid mutarotase
MRVIYSGAPRRKDLPYGSQLWISDEAGGLALQVSAGLRIVLHGTSQLEQNQAAKNAFIAAANRWEAIISTPITVVIDVDFGTTFFGQPYDPSVIGATGVSVVTDPYSDLRQRLINGASTSIEQQLYNALPATAVPVDFNGTSSNTTSAELSVPNARALGIVPDISDPNSVPLGQGDAGIGFNSAFEFDFSPDDGITSGQRDFDSVASHEMGHVLGFISDAGEAASPVTVWDLFRFRPATASLATFATAPRVMTIGGTQIFFGNQTSTFATLELELSTGGLDPGPDDGDGRQSSHWKDDALFSTRPYIGVMDPTLGAGIRRTISENDIMAIDLFGYSIGAPAPVRPPNDNFVNGIVLQNNSGTLTGSSVSATREAGEPSHAGFTGDKSVWYSWLSPVNGQITIDTIGSNFDTTLAVYTGAALNQLVNIASNDDIVNGQDKASRVQFNVTAGTTYRIAVDGWNGEYGSITLNWNATGVVPTPTPTPTPTPIPTPTPTPTPLPPCLDDLWTPTSTSNALSGRRFNSAVWTGTEMIVWGGQNNTGLPFGDGARYNPSTNTWTPISLTNAPGARFSHSAVWTGSEMIIWGGIGFSGELQTGGRYNPSTDTWTSISTANAPPGRHFQTTVWTGSEMIIWGGQQGPYFNSGARYNPSTDTWIPTSTTNAPVGRADHTAVWSGSEMIIWGGFNGVWLNSGGRYNPLTDSWADISTINGPAARAAHAAIWNGSEMIVWGGGTSTLLNTGGKYNPNTNSWILTTTTNAPAGRVWFGAVWSGTEMIIWGGSNGSFLNTGGRYNPVTDTWIATCDINAPTVRSNFTKIWTGSEIIVWGGDDSSFFRLNTGGRYSVQANPTPLLFIEESGPVLDQAVALDSLLFIRDPFPVVNPSVLYQGADRNTRVLVFVTHLQLLPGEPSSSVIVHLVDSNNQSFDIPAEDVRRTSSPVQVTFRLPNNLAVGTCTVTIKAHAQVSNPGTIRIRI